MRDIVLNTGPTIALVAATGSLQLLPQLYKRIIIPSEVAGEIAAGGLRNPETVALEAIEDSIEIGRKISDIPVSLLRELDIGEASVIHNAHCNGIDTVAIDEKSGRRVARIHGLKVTGSIGILLKAKRMGVIPSLSECIARMRQNGIWISSNIIEDSLREANESG